MRSSPLIVETYISVGKMLQKLFFIVAFCVALIAFDVSRVRVPLEAKDTLPVRRFMYERRLREIKVGRL